MTITVALDDAQKQQVVVGNAQQAQAIVNAAQPGVVGTNDFVYFAAFDGTNNDLQNKGSDQPTNVVEIWNQYQKNPEYNARLTGRYFPGTGTKGALIASSWLSPAVTQQVIKTAEQAYNDFAAKASVWLKTHQGASIAVALT